MKRPRLLTTGALVLLSVLAAQLLQAQARISFTNDAYLVIDNAAYLVIDNPNPNAITLGPGGGNVLSESENDLLRWNIGPATGTYVIPWTTGSGLRIPFVLDLTLAGGGAGHFLLSTHPDDDALNNWNNDDYRPSDVTNMGGPSIPNNSANAIDRFWRIQHSGYSTPPQATLDFGYDDAERTNPGNTIPAGSLFAQRFSTAQNAWIEQGLGTDNFPLTEVTGAAVSTDFYRSWTLSHAAVPLPDFDLPFQVAKLPAGGLCTWQWEGDPPLQFMVERAGESGPFVEIAALLGGEEAREWLDAAPLAGLNLYRLRADLPTGQHAFSEVETLVWEQGWAWSCFPNPLENGSMTVMAPGAKAPVQIEVTDLPGRRLFQWEGVISTTGEVLDLSGLPAGMYLLHLAADSESWGVKKFLVR